MKAMKLVRLGKGINILVHSSGRGYLFLDGVLVAVRVPGFPDRIVYNFGDRYTVSRDVRALGRFRKFYNIDKDNVLKRDVEWMADYIPEVL
jgi:hypothetical protein